MTYGLYVVLVAMGFIFYFTGTLVTKPHKNILLENTLPTAALTHPDVVHLTLAYKKMNLKLATLLALIGLPLLFINYDSLTFIWFFICFYLFMGAFYLNQIRAIGKMSELKTQHNWFVATEKGITIDTTLLVQKNRRFVKAIWFVPSVVATFAGAILTGSAFSSALAGIIDGLVMLVLIGLFAAIYYIVYHLPVKALTGDEKINQQLNDAFRHAWSKLAVLSCAVFALINLFFAGSLHFPSWLTIFSVALLAVIFAYIGYVFALLLKLRHYEDQLLATVQKIVYRGDDQFWRYSIYNNPHDHRLNVPDRIGMNISLNFGRPLGKVIYALIALVLLALPIGVSVPMLQADFSPNGFAATVTENTLQLKAPLTSQATIKLADIADVTTVDQLPTERVRINGTATTHFYTGHFLIDGKKARLYVYQPSTPIIKITTKDGDIFYFAGKTNAVNQALLDKITAR